jgi:hypothetical protein
MDNFDLKKFLVENKVTRNSNLFESDDFEFTDADKKMAANLNAKILKIGDTITPDMLNPDDQEYEYYSSDSWTIEDIYNDEGWLALLRAKTKTHMPYSPSLVSFEQDIDALNDELLKPQYYIEIPDDITSISDDPDYIDDINEADDDFEFTDLDIKLANQLGGELTIGDTITPDMWDKQKIEAMNTSSFRIIYDDIIKDSYLIKDIYFDEDPYAGDMWMVDLRDKNDYSWGIVGTPEELSFLNSILKDKHQIVSHD